MATSGPTQLPAFFNADADFRTFCQGINTALAAIGLIQTADTGQINNTTVSKPAGANTSQGYEIWRFNDALQSGPGSLPVYIKLEYGSENAIDRPGLWITVGTGSSGAGGITGQVGSRCDFGAPTSKSSGVTLPMYASGAADRVYLAANIDTGNNIFGFFFAVERSKDSNGNNTADGILLSLAGGAHAGFAWVGANQWIPALGSIAGIAANTYPGNMCCVSPGFFGVSLSGNNAAVAPMMIGVLGQWRYGLVLGTGSADFGLVGTFQATVLGATHTFLALNRACCSGNNPLTGTGTSGLAIPWE